MFFRRVLFVVFGSITVSTFCNDFRYDDSSDFSSEDINVKPSSDIVEIIDKEDLSDVIFSNSKKKDNDNEDVNEVVKEDEDVDEDGKEKTSNDIDDKKKDIDLVDDKRPTMYETLFENVEFSDEEKKMVGIEEVDKNSYTLHDAKYITFHDIKYGDLVNWKHIGRKRIDMFDLYSKEQESIYTIQDLGFIGSPSKYLVPIKRENIHIDFGYNVFDIYKRCLDDIIFFDTKMPLGDIRSTFNLDSADGFDLSVKTYYSKNKNIHFGAKLDLLIKGRGWEKVSDSNNKASIKNFPISAYFLYRGDNDKLLWLLNLDVNNFIHSDFGGIILEDNKMVGVLDDSSTVSGDEVLKYLLDAKLLGYFQYKFPKLYLYVQCILNYQRDQIDFNLKKEEKEEDKGDTKVKKVLLKKNKISSKTIARCFNSNQVDDYLVFINNDSFSQSSLEVGIKNNLLINNKIDFNYNAYYIFKFYTRSIRERVFDNLDPKEYKKNTILERRYYINPFILGGNFNIIDIDFKGEVSVAERNIFAKVDISYKSKYVYVDFCFTRYQIPLMFREYVCHDENIRQYSVGKDNEGEDFNIPMDLFLHLKGFLNIKNLIFNPYVKVNLDFKKLYFERYYDNDDKNISEPKQMKDLLLHTNVGLDFYINFLKYWTINSNIYFNFKKKLNGDEDANCEKLNNIPFFNLYVRGYFNKIFSNDVEVKAGAEFFFRTSFSPDFYDIFTQQFASQKNDFELTYMSKPQLNTYCNFRFGNFVGMLKLNLLNMFIDSYGMSTFNYPNSSDSYMLSLRYLIY